MGIVSHVSLFLFLLLTRRRPLLYPATGRGRTTVEYEDLDRLEEGEFLNDNILNFCLKYNQPEDRLSFLLITFKTSRT